MNTKKKTKKSMMTTPTSDKGSTENKSAISEKYNVFEMLRYNGLTFRKQTLPSDSISIADFVDSDKNEKTVDRLLSSRSIPFLVERQEFGWKGIRYRMIITVSRDKYQQVIDILTAAVKAKVLKEAEGIEGLIYF